MIRLLIISLLIIQSCAGKKSVPSVPKYTSEEAISKNLIEHGDIPIPHDTSKVIVVYNVVERDKNKISDETIRLFISDVFSTIVTILTIHNLDQANGQ